MGWVQANTKAIQAIHKTVVTHNPRVFVEHIGSTVWMLKIKNVHKEDSGAYMCQINTNPMISQVSPYLTISMINYIQHFIELENQWSLYEIEI